jgi:hypothetical protein
MTLTEVLVFLSLGLFSYADLRYRLVPGIEFFLLGAVLLSFPSAPLRTSIILMACAWGIFQAIPKIAGLLFLFYLPAWPVLLIGYGYRKGVLGQADLLVISGLACLFPFHAILLVLLGLEVWRRVWARKQAGVVPALPGILSGLALFMLLRLTLHHG